MQSIESKKQLLNEGRSSDVNSKYIHVIVHSIAYLHASNVILIFLPICHIYTKICINMIYNSKFAYARSQQREKIERCRYMHQIDDCEHYNNVY